jgi:hypothetical protein
LLVVLAANAGVFTTCFMHKLAGSRLVAMTPSAKLAVPVHLVNGGNLAFCNEVRDFDTPNLHRDSGMWVLGEVVVHGTIYTRIPVLRAAGGLVVGC